MIDRYRRVFGMNRKHMMNHKNHRFGLLAAALLAGLLALAVCCAAAAEARSGEWGEVHWELSEAGVLTVSGAGIIDDFSLLESERAEQAWQAYMNDIHHVVVEEGITSVGSVAFYAYPNLQTMSLPSSMTYLDLSAYTSCPELAEISVAQGCAEYCSENGILFNGDKTALMLYPAAKTGESYTVPAGVQELLDSSFRFNRYLKTIVLPDSLLSIGFYTFHRAASLEQVNLPESLTFIDWYAFKNCQKMKEITLPHSLTRMCSSVFCDCTALTKVTILGGLQNIETDAFVDCTNLTTVVLPKSVTGIWNNAFENCDHLKKVYYAGSEEDRENIGIGPHNEALENAKWVYGTSGTTYDITEAKIDKISAREYTGKAIHPSPRVTWQGTVLTRDTDYTLAYQNCKQVGLATVTVTGIGRFDGVRELTFKIVPAGVRMTHLKAGEKQLTVQWKMNASVSGYEIEYGTKKDFSNAEKLRIEGADQNHTVLTGLKAKKKYYVRIRAWQKADGKTYYSPWSDAKSKTTK